MVAARRDADGSAASIGNEGTRQVRDQKEVGRVAQLFRAGTLARPAFFLHNLPHDAPPHTDPVPARNGGGSRDGRLIITSHLLRDPRFNQPRVLLLGATVKDEKQLTTLSKETVAIIGAGKMGGAILDSLISSAGIPAERLRITVKHRERAHLLGERLKLTVATDNASAARGADLI